MHRFKLILVFSFFIMMSYGQNKTFTIDIPLNTKGDSNQDFIEAFEKAKGNTNGATTINLSKGNYYFSREKSYKKKYYVSNTTSEEEDDDPTKHIALHLNQLKNVTINGNGATLIMKGEMTSLVLNDCQNITLKNLNFDYEYPTQTELKIIGIASDHILAEVHPTSQYRIDHGQLTWYGDGWSFTKGIAQAYDHQQDITWRSESPMRYLIRTEQVSPNKLKMYYDRPFKTTVGFVYQMRDAIRDEVAGFINKSKDIRLEGVNFYYLGNFGVVCQFSENITFDRMNFAPEENSGRTNAGFADFIQVSSCKGLIDIKNSTFIGAHDDPINVHGTHLKVVEIPNPKQIKVRYMHPQTYGFEPFFSGDKIEFIHSSTLNLVEKSTVNTVDQINEREFVINLTQPLSPNTISSSKDLVVENTTWTPAVKITNNYFSRIPTRGILVTTRKKVTIENNIFHRMQMSGILIANDALSWYESGMVKDVSIKGNTFYECGYPIINIAPENKIHHQAVHENIRIEGNNFILRKDKGDVLNAKSVKGLKFINNKIFIGQEDHFDLSNHIKLENAFKVQSKNNIVKKETFDFNKIK